MGFLINATIQTLSICSPLSRSPIFGRPPSFKMTDFRISQSYFSHQLSGIYNSHSPKDKLSVDHSTFSKLLHRAITISSMISIDNHEILFPLRLTKEIFVPAKIKNCKFIALNGGTAAGGAILTFARLFVDNCLFYHCMTLRTAGAIACYGPLSVSRSVFTGCNSLNVAAIITDSANVVDVKMISCSLDECRSETDGIVMLAGDSNMEQICTNASRNNCYTPHNCFFYQNSMVKNFGCIYSENSNSEVNLGITLIYAKSMNVEFSCFRDLIRRGSLDMPGVAIYINEAPYSAELKVSNSFFPCNGYKNPVIYVRMGPKIHISNCCFRESQTSQKKGFMSVFNNCKFESECEFSPPSIPFTSDFIEEETQEIIETQRIDYEINIYDDKSFYALLFITLLLLIIVLIMNRSKIKCKKAVHEII